MAKSSAKRRIEAQQTLKPQVVKMNHAVSITRAKYGYDIHYLEIPEADIAKYRVRKESQTLALVPGKIMMHFERNVVAP